MKKLLTFIFLCGILLSQTIQFKIIETSDIHGNMFPYDFKNDRVINYSLAQASTHIKSERAKNQEIILLDNGDILQGTPLIYYYNFEYTDTTNILASVMNYMEYDAATIGNHDIETGHDVYDKFVKEIDFPWLAANAINTETSEPYFEPYSIIEKEGIKIAIIGLITPAIPKWLPEKIWEGIYFADMIVSAQEWIDFVTEVEKPELIIGLFHAGVDYTYGGLSAETPYNENASRLVAEQVPGFDVIFVGHDHQEWNFKVENSLGDSVLILGPAASGRSLAEANISLSFDSTSSVWNKNIDGKVVDLTGISPDEELLEKFSSAKDSTIKYVSKKIGQISKNIHSKDALFGDSEFMNIIHTFQLDKTGADISFASPLSFNSVIKKGDLFVKDMFNLYRYENLLYTMELSGKEIKDYLEYSSSLWFNQMQDSSDNLFNFEKNESSELILDKKYKTPVFKERYYNFSSAAGISYKIDVTKQVGNRVIIDSLENGKNFELEQKYKVAVNSYRGNGGGGHLVKGAKINKEDLSDRILNSTEKDLRYFLMKWIESKGTLDPKKRNNWEIIPETYYELARSKDLELLFK